MKLKFGLFYGVILLLSEYTILEKYLFPDEVLLKDLIMMLLIVSFAALSIRKIIKEKLEYYTFWKGYSEGFKIGIIGIVIYLIVGLLLNGYIGMHNSNFTNSLLDSLPNMMGKSVANIIPVGIASFIIPIFYLFRLRSKNHDILDDEVLKY